MEKFTLEDFENELAETMYDFTPVSINQSGGANSEPEFSDSEDEGNNVPEFSDSEDEGDDAPEFSNNENDESDEEQPEAQPDEEPEEQPEISSMSFRFGSIALRNPKIA